MLKGYTVENMAEELGLDKSTYSRIENGHIKLDIDKLKKISQILEIEWQLLEEWDHISWHDLTRKMAYVLRLERQLSYMESELARLREKEQFRAEKNGIK